MVTKSLSETESPEFRTLVAINSGDNREFTKKVSEELRGKGLSVMHNPAARDVAGRIRNLSLSIDQALRIDAELVVCVNCRKPDSAKEIGLEESEKGGSKPVVNVLSPKLLETTALCKDLACVKKFPGEIEESIWKVIDEFSKEGVKRIPLDELSKRFHEHAKDESAAGQWVRRALKHMSEGRFIAEIEVFPKNEEEAMKAVKDCGIIVQRLREFSSKKRDAADTRLSL
jgi:hypothetical protein